MHSTRAILFDLYGTLFISDSIEDAHSSFGQCLSGFLKSLGVELQQAGIEDLFEHFWAGEEISPRSDVTLFERRLAGFLSKLHIPWDRGLISMLASRLCSAWQELYYVDPVAGDVLEKLGARSKLGVVTNFDHPPHIHTLLGNCGLKSYFNTVVVSADVGVQKPDPEILLIACERIGVTPEESVYIGDSIVDCQAAMAAAISPVIIRRPKRQEIEKQPRIAARYTDSDDYLEKFSKEGRLRIVDDLRCVAEGL
jgi:putative hydrolase of the HAD superfamily